MAIYRKKRKSENNTNHRQGSGEQPRWQQQLLLLRHLHNGSPAIVLCDTIYGIVATAAAKERLCQLKKRDQRPFIHLLGSFQQLNNLLAAPLPEMLLHCWPGPLTCIVNSQQQSLAVRIPASRWLRRLIVNLGQPLLSTSVNLSGEPALHRFEDIARHFQQPDLLLLNGGPTLDQRPSTLIDVRQSPFKLLRQGSFTIPAKLKILFA